MPSIIIEEIVTNVELNIEEVLTTVVLEISEMQMPGISAYQVAINNGFVGTEPEWLLTLEGAEPTTEELTALVDVVIASYITEIDTALDTINGQII